MNETNHRLLLPILAGLLAISCGGTELNDENTGEASPENTGEASLAVSADGPFASVAAIQAYWAAQPPDSYCLNVYANGHNVYSHSGFGPCDQPEYFQCDTGTFQAHCNSLMAGASTKGELIAQMGSNPTVYVDGKLYRTGTTGMGYIATCYGDQGSLGAVRYYVATFFCYGSNGVCFGPPVSTLGHCY